VCDSVNTRVVVCECFAEKVRFVYNYCNFDTDIFLVAMLMMAGGDSALVSSVKVCRSQFHCHDVTEWFTNDTTKSQSGSIASWPQ